LYLPSAGLDGEGNSDPESHFSRRPGIAWFPLAAQNLPIAPLVSGCYPSSEEIRLESFFFFVLNGFYLSLRGPTDAPGLISIFAGSV